MSRRDPPGTGKSRDERQGLALMLAEDVVWGLYPVFTRDLVSSVDPIFAAGVASLAGALPFIGWLGLKGQLHHAARSDLRWGLLAIALLATVLASLCFFTGVSRTSGINASLLGQSEPLYSVILASLFLKEAVSRAQLGAMALLVGGAVAVLWKDGITLRDGDLLILLTPLWYQLSHLFAKRLMPRLPSTMLIPAVRLSVGGAILLAIALVWHPETATVLTDGGMMARLVLFGLVFMSLEKLLFYEALKRLDLAKASALLVPSVAVGVVGSWWILGEALALNQLVGLVLILGGLVWMASGRLSSAERPA